MTIIQSTEATLRTLNVSIQALTVNGKQMTLAVFRQLPKFWDLYDDKGNLISEIKFWGRVLYKIKDEGDEWVVMEKDGVLFRTQIPDDTHTKAGDVSSEISWHNEVVDNFKARNPIKKPKFMEDSDRYEHYKLFVRRSGTNVSISWDDEKRDGYLTIKEFKEYMNAEASKLKQQYKEAKIFDSNIKAIITVMSGLPQLFIAV